MGKCLWERVMQQVHPFNSSDYTVTTCCYVGVIDKLHRSLCTLEITKK